MCLVDFDLLSAVQASELYHHNSLKVVVSSALQISHAHKARTQPHHQALAVNVSRNIHRFNDFSAWVASTVLRELDLQNRIAIVEYWIQVAQVHYLKETLQRCCC